MQKLSFILLAITLTFTVSAKNLLDYNTQYPVWHYFDNSLGNLGTSPYVDSVSGTSVDPGTSLCNRGIGATQRNAMKFDGSANGIYKYDISELKSKGWFVLQIDGDFKVEMSNDKTSWTTVLTANGNYAWTDKGPTKNMSPYYIDIKNFLGSNYLYVRISDNTPGDSNGARALNALITENGYPNIFAGGDEPTVGSGRYNVGDQQFLFSKDNTSDREVDGRFADGNNKFVYKFDLPDDEDDCELITYIAQQYKLEISKDWDFSTVFYSTQSLDTASAFQRVCVNLKPLLSQLSDNVIYFRMGDAVTSSGWGGIVKRLWISPKLQAIGKSFKSTDELETTFMWDDNGSQFVSSWGFRFTDYGNYITYRFNLGADATNLTTISINTQNEYLFQGSSNGTDWVNLFVAPDGYRTAESLMFYPFTGNAVGYGAQTGIGNLVAPVFDGCSNVFFLRMGDSKPSDGWGGQMKGISVEGINTSNFSNVKTFFQINEYYSAQTDIPVDAMLVDRHGSDPATLQPSIQSWEDHGFNVGRMFFADSDAGNIYWQGGWDGATHTNDCEHDSSGNIVFCAGVRPYMVPTTNWTAYLEDMVERSINAGAIAIFPEEPLAHITSGYSESFKSLWVERYGTAWQAQNSSQIAQFKTAQLQSELYLNLELNLLNKTKGYSPKTSFVIPIHSIFGNIAASLTAPLGMSVGTNDIDGYIGQIWTGPVNWALDNYNSSDESFFASAYALYDFFTQLTIGNDRKLWLLVDPVEDNPSHTWNEYLEWYRHCVSAMLFMPEVDNYEVMPWPERIFRPGYSTGGGSPAPEGFRIQVLTITEVLQEIQKGGEWLTSSKPTDGIGIAIADSSMYMQRSSPKLQGIYGQLMPLIRRGIPVSSFDMERVQDTNYADNFKVIILSYEDFKPVREEMNTALADWVKRGGSLLVLGATTDSLDGDSYFWWHALGYNSPIEHLMDQFGGGYGSGNVIRNTTSPSNFANTSDAENTYLPLVRQAVNNSSISGSLNEPGNFCMRRGDFVTARSAKSNLWVQGKFVDIYDTNLSVITDINLTPGQSGLYKDVTDILNGTTAAVLHTTHRLIACEYSNYVLRFEVKGPEDTPAVIRIFTPVDTYKITARNANNQKIDISLRAEGNTCMIKFPNDTDGITVTADFSPSTVTNVYEFADNISGLSAQPQAHDLTQMPGATNLLISGSMHSGVTDNKFEYLFNSNVDGSYGPGGQGGNGIVLFSDGISPDYDAIIHCDFDTPREIQFINVFSFWGDQRLFTYFEVWVSDSGTNDSDYTKIGIITFGENSESNTPYAYKHCLAQMYDPTDGIIADNIISVKLVQKNCGYGIEADLGVKHEPGTPQGSYVAITGSAVGEIDIIGVPEPFFLSFFVCCLLFINRIK